MLRIHLLRAFALAGAAFVLVQCSGKPRDLRGDCRDRFESIHERYEQGRYAYAKQGYTDFVLSCAGTEHAEQAHYELADSHFQLKEWMEAEIEFSAFLRDYPNSRRYGEMARWQRAMSLGSQTRIPQRDQTITLDAMRDFETFLADFPLSTKADSARMELERLGHLLAERDMLIARLYRRMDEPLAAAIYYRKLLNDYGDRVPRREINLKLADSYIQLEQFAEAENILARFDGIAEDDPFAREVQKLHGELEKARDRRERSREREERQQSSP